MTFAALFLLILLSPAALFGQSLDPKIMSEWPPYRANQRPNALEISGTTAFLAAGDAFISVDVSDPLRPRWLAGANVTGGDPQTVWFTQILGIRAHERSHRLYVLYSDAFGSGLDPSYFGVAVYDLDRPTALTKLGEFRVSTYSVSSDRRQPVSMETDGEFVYVAHQGSREGTITSIDFRDPTRPVPRPSLSLQQKPSRIFAHDGNLYIAFKSYESIGFGNFGIFSGYHLVSVGSKGELSIVHTYKTGAPSNTLDRPNDLVVAGDFVYFAEPWSGIKIIDALLPKDPIVVSRYDLASPSMSLSLNAEQQQLFVATSDKGLLVLNVSNPNAPKLAASLPAPKTLSRIAFSKGMGATLDEITGGLAIFTVGATPQSVAFQSTYFEPTSASSAVAHQRSTAYVGYKSDGVVILDVSNLSTPKRVAHIAAGNVNDLAVRDNSLIVATATGVSIFDVETPDRPRPIADFPLGNTEKVRMEGATAFVFSSRVNELVALSVSTTPKILSRIPVSGLSDFLPQGNTLYAINDGSLSAFDITDPSRISPLRLTGNTFVSGKRIAAANGNLIVLNDGAFSGSISVLGISSITQLSLLGRTSFGTFSAGTTAATGNRLFSSDGYIFDISAPAAIRVIGKTDLRVSGTQVRLNGGLAFYAGATPAVTIANVCPELNPRPVSAYEVPSTPMAVRMVGTTAYVAAGASGIQLIQYQNPASPSPISTFDTPGAALDLAVEGATVFVADGPAGLQAIDTSNPVVLRRIGQFDTPGHAQAVQIRNHVAYVADGNSLQVLNVENPRQIVRIATVSDYFSDLLRSIALTGDRAFLCCGSDVGRPFLAHMPISDQAPVGSLQRLYLPSQPTSVANLGSELFLSVPGLGIMIFAIASDGTIQPVRTVPTRRNPYRISASDHRVFVSHTPNGFSILDLQNREVPRVQENGVWAKLEGIIPVGPLLYAAGASLSGKGGLIVFEPIDASDDPLRGEYQSDQSFAVRLGAVATGSYKLERSADLRTWTEWQQFIVNDCEKGRTFIDDTRPRPNRMFYRLVQTH